MADTGELPTATEPSPQQVAEAIIHDIEHLARHGHVSASALRGPANEVRSVLWDVLERLAPDDEVLASGVKLEKGRSRPTQKQKVRYILSLRGVGETGRKAPEKATEVVEELVGGLTRGAYDRSSAAAHVASERTEVMQIKMYVETVLAELLEIHSHG